MSDEEFKHRPYSVGVTVKSPRSWNEIAKDGNASIDERLIYAVSAPIYERDARRHGGPPKHHAHRFPIAGGLNSMEVLGLQMSKPNQLFERFAKKGK